MSWFSKNYQKAVLGGAVVIALGLAYWGWSDYSGVGTAFAAGLKGQGNNNAAVRDGDRIPMAMASMKRDRTWVQALDGDRPVDLFVGIPLFVRSSSPEPIDLRGLKTAPVHPPIPNTWWLDNHLDPGFADSPNSDPDHDGFSNLEEFNAKTDPNNPLDYPSLITKLMYVKDESLTWVLRPGFGSEGSFPFIYKDSKGGTNKTEIAAMVAPGGLFFSKAPMSNRFKFLSSEVRKEVNKRTTLEKEITIVKIEDQRPNKKGMIYEIPAPLAEERMNEHVKYDRTAVFSLEALGMTGKEFRVEENIMFSLPPENPKKEYLVKTITPDSVVVEYSTPSGEKKTAELVKGTLNRKGE